MKSISTSATHNVCPAECQNSNDKVVLWSSSLRGGLSRRAPLRLSSRFAQMHLSTSPRPALCIHICIRCWFCVCIWICVFICICVYVWICVFGLPSRFAHCPVAVEHLNPNIFLLLALSLLWNSFETPSARPSSALTPHLSKTSANVRRHLYTDKPDVTCVCSGPCSHFFFLLFPLQALKTAAELQSS